MLLLVFFQIFRASGVSVEGAVAPGRAQVAESGKRDAFEVVSVRPSRPGGQLSFGATASGFRAQSTPLFWILLDAYCPLSPAFWRNERVMDAPGWVRTQGFDIEARVSEGEFAHLTDEQREATVKPMLRALVEERFRVRVHMLDRPAFVWALTVAKHDLKLEPSKSGAAVPGGISIGDGGVMVHVPMEGGRHGLRFYRTSMAKVAEVLSGLGSENDLPIVDQTNLKGRFDFVLTKREFDRQTGDQAGEAPAAATLWDVQALGLRLRRVERDLPTVVVDHVEEPTAN